MSPDLHPENLINKASELTSPAQADIGGEAGSAEVNRVDNEVTKPAEQQVNSSELATVTDVEKEDDAERGSAEEPPV